MQGVAQLSSMLRKCQGCATTPPFKKSDALPFIHRLVLFGRLAGFINNKNQVSFYCDLQLSLSKRLLQTDRREKQDSFNFTAKQTEDGHKQGQTLQPELEINHVKWR